MRVVEILVYTDRRGHKRARIKHGDESYEYGEQYDYDCFEDILGDIGGDMDVGHHGQA